MPQYPRWTGPELELAARADLTALQVANAIGRTVNAVRGARRQLRIDPRKINLAGIHRERSEKSASVEPSVESWGVTVDEAREMLRLQMCPICCTGPWKSPLNHVARAHGVDRLTMRDICGLSMRDKVTDPEASAAWSENGKKMADVLAANTNARKGSSFTVRRTLRFQESAGKSLRDYVAANPEAMAAIRAGFRERMTSPEAKAKWEASMQRVRAERVYTPEERAAATARLQSPEAKAKRAAYNEARRQDECTVDGCTAAHVARGYCRKHWRKWQLYGDPLGNGKIGKPRALSEVQEKQALKMLATGQSQHSVAKHFGCSQRAIGRMVQRHRSLGRG